VNELFYRDDLGMREKSRVVYVRSKNGQVLALQQYKARMLGYTPMTIADLYLWIRSTPSGSGDRRERLRSSLRSIRWEHLHLPSGSWGS